ncbi:MAG: hypothetical protein KDD44_04600, partial [Bdellovibrionales bacterium]|nr:hypothetical protein [Bdellovibrionales bacterium]
RDSRYDSWGFVGASGLNCHEGSLVIHGLGRYYDDRDPWGELAAWFEKNWTSRPMLVDLPGPGTCSAQYQLPNLLLQNGTCWTRFPRPCLGITGGKLATRLEWRADAAMPPAEVVATHWVRLCLMRGVYFRFGRELSRMVTYDQAIENLAEAALHGPDAELWYEGRKVPARELWREVLLRMVDSGHDDLHFSDRTKDRYQPLVLARLEEGGTGAELIERYWDRLPGDGLERGKRLTLELLDVQEQPWSEWPRA